MALSTLGKTYVFLFIGLMAMILPMARFDGEVDGVSDDPTSADYIDPDRFSWTCGLPIASLNAADTDLEAVRADIAALEADIAAGDAEPETILNADHPDCRTLSRVQFVIGVIALAATAYLGRKWWIETADERAEKKFKKLHTPPKTRKVFGS
ncbi:MAG: hypothetical protein ACI8Y4_001193 [Candidatus Poriferisodalaceae bacterium]